MLAKRRSRGVLMTASSRRPQSWREEEILDSDGEEEESEEDAEDAKDSNREWAEIERVVREEKRLIVAKEQFASGNRGSVVVYDDAVGDEDLSEKPPVRVEPRDERVAIPPDAADDADVDDAEKKYVGALPVVQGPALHPNDDRNELERPDGIVTAGQVQRGKRRGGKQETGGSKRLRKKTAEEEAAGPKKDPDKWVKLKLTGDKTTKKIDATRVVHYHDFDSRGVLFQAKEDEDSAPAPAIKAEASGNYRAGLRMDLFEPETDEEEAETGEAAQSK